MVFMVIYLWKMVIFHGDLEISQVMERHDTSRGQLVDSLGAWEGSRGKWP